MKEVLISCFLIITFFHLNGQGCSDAGLCTSEPFKPVLKPMEGTDPNKLSFGLNMGVADYTIAVYGGGLGYSRNFGDQWRIDSKITFLSQGGNDIHVTGPGDIFVNLNYMPSRQVAISMGAKIPLTQADKMADGLPLPMDYQSSLGTLDFLGGISYTLENWFFAVGVQIPIQQNENEFFADLYAPDSPLALIQSTNQFERSADVLLRISRPIAVNEKMTITPGLLPIFHLGEDQFTDVDGVEKPIDGSGGFTLNGTVFLDYKLSAGNALEFSLGFPFIVREARPDGLTRSFVLGIGYTKRF